MPADFAHSTHANENRRRKAAALYLAAALAGHTGVPAERATRLQIRKDAELDRDPSPETWDLVDAMLRLWPPATHCPAGSCEPDPDDPTGPLFEARPVEYSTHRFPGRLCPHTAPPEIGINPRLPGSSRVPTITDADRAGQLLALVYQHRAQAHRDQPEETRPDAPTPPPALPPQAAEIGPVPQPGALPRRAGGQAGPGGDGPPPPAEREGRTPSVPVHQVPRLAPDQPGGADAGDVIPAELLGLEVRCDDSMPPDTIELRQPDGSVAARMTVQPGGRVETEILQPDPAQPVNPHRITVALDRAGLTGPTADAKLDAVEPALDRWEAGQEQPTAAQLRKLAGLANVPLEFFWLPDDAEPQLIRAFLCGGRGRASGMVITMRGEPAGRPQEQLGGDEWWQF